MEKLWDFTSTMPRNMKDVELGIRARAQAEKLKKSRNMLIGFTVGVVLLLILVCYLFSSSDEKPKTVLESLTPTEHPSHDRTDEVLETPILTAGAKVYHRFNDVPDDFWEPCRRLSREELISDLIIEGYQLTDVLMTMCRVLHETVGCEGEGSLPVKLLNLDPVLNTCIMTYKDREGKCSHFLNPVIQGDDSARSLKISYQHRHFPYTGKVLVHRTKNALVTHQPIPDDAHRERRVVPNLETIGFSHNRSLYVQHAYSILQGSFPPKHGPIPQYTTNEV